MTHNQLEVLAWWHGGKDYYTGVSILSRYSKNKVIVQSLNKAGKHKFPANVEKLNYEIAKSVHLNWKQMPPLPESSNTILEYLKTSEFSDKSILINSLPDNQVINKNTDVDDLQKYPKVIRRIKYEYSELYNNRSVLHTNMRSVDQVNTTANNKIRAELLKSIKTISTRLEFLFGYVNEYDKNGTIPLESDIWEVNETVPEAPKSMKDLIKVRYSLVNSNTKSKNLLLYRQRGKGLKENPMPDGPKKKNIEANIALREQKIAAIDKQILLLQNAG